MRTRKSRFKNRMQILPSVLGATNNRTKTASAVSTKTIFMVTGQLFSFHAKRTSVRPAKKKKQSECID